MQPGRNAAKVLVVDSREAVKIVMKYGFTALIDKNDWPKVAPYRWNLTRCGSNCYV